MLSNAIAWLIVSVLLLASGSLFFYMVTAGNKEDGAHIFTGWAIFFGFLFGAWAFSKGAGL